MEKAFKNLIKSHFPYLGGSKLLLAVSGGVDSVVLAHLCKKVRMKFALAHCNFNLRAQESDSDEGFVKDLARRLEVEVLTENFNTKKYAEEHKLSIQMAARELRYEWFYQLSRRLELDYILTAHHANDNLETFLINLIRGTGLEGLSGIKTENNNVIRPFLHFSRKEIKKYALENQIEWREDSSNASNKYIRNKIRQDFVPMFEELNPQFLESFMQTQSHLKESLDLVEDYVNVIYREAVKKNEFGYELDVEFLQKLPNTKAVLYQLLKSFGFTEWNDVYHLIFAQPGKMVFSDTHRLIKDRDKLLLTERVAEHEFPEYKIRELEDAVILPMGNFIFTKVEEIEEKSKHCIYVAAEKIKFPLIVRKWKNGDFFQPFGMKGKKKLSDFFKDEKLSLPQKENTWLLCCGQDIMWVIGHRADGRFAISSPDQKIIKITCSL